jgi:nitroreductase
MDVLPEIVQRRSVRRFSDRAVEKAKLERILKAGQLAPSAKNRQEWRFIVVQKPSLKEDLARAAFGQPCVSQSGAVIAICPTNIDYRMPNGQLSFPLDLAIAAAFMTLQATREGLGTCLVTTFDQQQARDALSVPFSIPVVLLLVVGYADEEPEPQPRKPLRDVSSWGHW